MFLALAQPHRSGTHRCRLLRKVQKTGQRQLQRQGVKKRICLKLKGLMLKRNSYGLHKIHFSSVPPSTIPISLLSKHNCQGPKCFSQTSIESLFHRGKLPPKHLPWRSPRHRPKRHSGDPHIECKVLYAKILSTSCYNQKRGPFPKKNL
jgi:hypothetical protein